MNHEKKRIMPHALCTKQKAVYNKRLYELLSQPNVCYIMLMRSKILFDGNIILQAYTYCKNDSCWVEEHEYTLITSTQTRQSLLVLLTSLVFDQVTLHERKRGGKESKYSHNKTRLKRTPNWPELSGPVSYIYTQNWSHLLKPRVSYWIAHIPYRYVILVLPLVTRSVIVKYIGKVLSKTKSFPSFYWWKLSTRK